jgi:Terminase large subunit, T4likevirus-type, N-terminal
LGWSLARNGFPLYRRTIHRGLLWDWWAQEVSERLQQFYTDLAAGKRPKMAIMSPPQHGKTTAAIDFVTWVAGKNPNLKTIYASLSDQLGERANREVQRIMRSPAYVSIFGRTRLDLPGWSVNTTLIEFGDYNGSFRNTTVEGQINGLELHLGLIDDPHKGRNEALSKANRDRIWNWFADDWLARFHKDAGMLAIMTRWHVDDMLGRFIERFPEDMPLPGDRRGGRGPRHQARALRAQGWRGAVPGVEAVGLPAGAQAHADRGVVGIGVPAEPDRGRRWGAADRTNKC